MNRLPSLDSAVKKMYTELGYNEQGEKIIWDFEPVDILTFVTGQEYLDLGGSVRQNVLEDLQAIFGDDPFRVAPLYNYAIFSEAVGTGKTFRQSVMALYMVYKLLCLHDPIDYFNSMREPGQPKLSKDTKLAVILMAVTADNARKVIYTEVGNKLANSPWFKKHYPPVSNIKTERQFDPRPDDFTKIEDRIYKNVYIIPGSSSEYAAVGYNIIMAIIDEATLFEDTKDASLAGGADSNDQAEVVYTTLDSRITSRFGNQGLLVIAGNPKHEEDFLERHAADASNSEDTYIITRRPLWDSTYPEFDPDATDKYGRPKYPHFYFHLDDLEIVDSRMRHLPNVIPVPDIGKLRSAFKTKPEIAKRDLAGYPTSAVGRVISDPTLVIRNINKDRECPLDVPLNILIPHSPKLFLQPWFEKKHHVWHAIHFDLAKKGDAAAMCVSHVYDYDENNDPLVYVDLMVRWQGTAEDEFKLDIARHWVEYLHDELMFDFGIVTADTWQSSYLLELLREKGYKTGTLSVDTSNDPYDELIQCIRSRRLDYYKNDIFINELTNLERRKGKYEHHRRGCFAGDTKVALLDGTNPTLKELSQIGGLVPIYTSTKEGAVVPAYAHSPRLVEEQAETVIVELDNGVEVTCTPDHRWKLLDGSYKEARHLEHGDRLFPLYRRWDFSRANMEGYEKVYQPLNSRRSTWEYTHRLVADNLVKKPEGASVVHHVDGTKTNNSPDNLRWVTLAEHASLHSSTEWGKKLVSEYAQTVNKENGYADQKKNMLKLHQNPIFRQNMLEAIQKRRIEIPLERMKEAISYSRIIKEAAAYLGVSKATLLRRLREHGLSFTKVKEEVGTKTDGDLNHIVLSVKPGPKTDVYDLTVDETHNYALACGVFVHNSKDVSDAVAGSVYNAIRCGRYGEPPMRAKDRVGGNRAYTIGPKTRSDLKRVRRVGRGNE